MPIKVSHQPSAFGVGGAAYSAGLGEYGKWLRQQQLREAALAQDAAQSQQAMALQAAGRQQAAYENAADRQFRAGAMQFGAQQDAAKFAAARGLAVADAAKRRAWEVEDRDKGIAAAKDRDAEIAARMEEDDKRRATEARLAADEAAIKAAEDDRRAWIKSRYDSGEWELDGAATRRLEELTGQRTAVLTDPKWAPDKKAAKLRELENEYWGILENPSPPVPGSKPPTFAEKVESGSYRKPIIDPISKRQLGYEIWQQERKSGEAQHKTTVMFKDGKDEDAAKNTEWKTFFKANQIDADGNKQSLSTIRRKFQEHWSGIEAGPDDIPPLEEGGQQMGQPQRGRTYSEDDLSEEQVPGYKQLPSMQDMVPGGAAPQIGGGPDTSGMDEPQIAPELQQAANNELPRPKSREEALSLGPGAFWIAPDGSMGQNPQ
jgi:hypothetical protein